MEDEKERILTQRRKGGDTERDHGSTSAAKLQPKKKKRTADGRRWTRMEKETPTSLGNLVANLVDCISSVQSVVSLLWI